jgi:acetolactate synthase-1/2/3 large subunit
MIKSKISVSEQIANFISSKATPAVFQLSGGMIAFISDAVARLGHTKIINLKHEQSAGFAAEGISRVTGIPSVVLATSGPGATNLVTPIASCFFDSTPVIFITGQVHTNEIKKNKLQRQNGFQELNITELVSSIVKVSIKVESATQVLGALETAWSIAQEGRPGPVLIDIPIDVQQMDAVAESNYKVLGSLPEKELLNKSIDTLKTLLKQSKSPLILVGGGVRISKSIQQFRNFIEISRIPVVYSLMGKDVLPNDHELNFGFIGSYGNRTANQSLMQSDLLIVLGSRLDIRQTGPDIEDFTSGKRIFRVDIDEHELQGRLIAEFSYRLDLNDFLKKILSANVSPYDSKSIVLDNIERKKRYQPFQEQSIIEKYNPNFIVEIISELESNTENFVVDVGQHQMWSAQSLNIKANQRFLTSGGLGAMGFSLPTAIGISSATNERTVVIVGDGCAQLNTNELETIKYYNLPITIYIINNMQHGMVAQFQEENLKSNFIGTRFGYSVPDFVKIAEAYGIKALKVKNPEGLELMATIRNQTNHGPLLFDILIKQDYKALPKVGKKVKLSDL